MKPTDFIIDYDLSDPHFLGKPKHFDPDHYLDTVEQMVAADEVINALKMLDMVPAYYRQYPTERMINLKKEIYNHTWNISSYVKDKGETYQESLEYQKKLNPEHQWDDLGTMIDIAFCFPRGPLVEENVRNLNNQGIVPFIWEMGPANFWLPYGLKKKGLKFNYYSTSLQKEALEEAKVNLKEHWKNTPDEGQYQIFVCFETIEHLWQEEDILHQYHRYGADADMIFMSTPCGTLVGGVGDWRRDLGHLRTYNIKELMNIGAKFWPEHSWQGIPHVMMVAIGVKNGKSR